jgi:hypothetical protein
VHALLRIVLATGNLNLQANTPVLSVGQRDADGRVEVKTERGTVHAKAVLHATVSVSRSCVMVKTHDHRTDGLLIFFQTSNLWSTPAEQPLARSKRQKVS